LAVPLVEEKRGLVRVLIGGIMELDHVDESSIRIHRFMIRHVLFRRIFAFINLTSIKLGLTLVGRWPEQNAASASARSA
jgi:hypothetical protein